MFNSFVYNCDLCLLVVHCNWSPEWSFSNKHVSVVHIGLPVPLYDSRHDCAERQRNANKKGNAITTLEKAQESIGGLQRVCILIVESGVVCNTDLCVNATGQDILFAELRWKKDGTTFYDDFTMGAPPIPPFVGVAYLFSGDESKMAAKALQRLNI